MKHLAVELRRLSETLTLSALAEASGVPRTSLSNYTSLRARISQKHLKAICEALEEPDRARLVSAHLLDERPDSARHLVDITPKLPTPADNLKGKGKSSAAMPATLGGDAAAVLAEIERMMLADPSFSQWLSVTIGMIRS